jgi:hypothetical protein
MAAWSAPSKGLDYSSLATGWIAERCTIAKTLEVISTRSAFLILREAFYGTSRLLPLRREQEQGRRWRLTGATTGLRGRVDRGGSEPCRPRQPGVVVDGVRIDRAARKSGWPRPSVEDAERSQGSAASISKRNADQAQSPVATASRRRLGQQPRLVFAHSGERAPMLAARLASQKDEKER